MSSVQYRGTEVQYRDTEVQYRGMYIHVQCTVQRYRGTVQRYSTEVQYRGTEVQYRGTYIHVQCTVQRYIHRYSIEVRIYMSSVQYMYYHVQRSGDTHLLALHSNNG